MSFHNPALAGASVPAPGTHARPLTNNVTCRILVSAGKIKGEHDFGLKQPPVRQSSHSPRLELFQERRFSWPQIFTDRANRSRSGFLGICVSSAAKTVLALAA
jgi:hypothetical protein